MGDRLGAGELHRAEIDDGDGAHPAEQPGRSATSAHRAATSMIAATMLAAAKNGASWAREISWTSLSGELSPSSLAARQAKRFPVGKPRRNHALIAIWGFVHPLPALHVRGIRLAKERLSGG